MTADHINGLFDFDATTVKPAAAHDHYLMLTDDHFAAATKTGDVTGGWTGPNWLVPSRKRKPAPFIRWGKTLVLLRLWASLKMP